MERAHEQRSHTADLETDLLDFVTSLQRLHRAHTTTNFPHLDILAHDSDPPLQQATDSACTFPIPCDSKPFDSNSPQGHPQAVLNPLQRYARFIIGLTGQDTISIWCNITTALRTWCGIIVAERPLDDGSQYHLRVVEDRTSSTTAVADLTHFSFHSGSFEHWREWSSTHVFSLTARAGAEFHVKLPTCSVPEAAIKSLLHQVQLQLAGPENLIETPSDQYLSVLNHHAAEFELSSGLSSSTNLLLHELFESQARQTPDHCAIEFLHPENPRESLTRLTILSYKELSDRCSILANELRAILNTDHSQHLQNRIVPVFLSTSPELYISYLAILKAGYAFCPLPTDAPSQRLKDILDDIKPSVVLGVGSVPENGPWHEASCSFNITWLDVQCSTQRSHKTSASQLTPGSLAYLMYTSGSTGKGKGVQITHQAATASIVAHMKQHQESTSPNVPMRWYQFAAPTFDPSIMEIFVTLCCGGTLCSAPREMTLSSPEAAITETRSTIMMATPGFASILDADRLPTLRCLWTMGETLGRRVIDRFVELETLSSQAIASNGKFSTNVNLCNAYGPTEAAINVTFFPNVPTNMRGSIIGYPLGTSSILVIVPNSSEIKPVPLGFVGELVIVGRQVSVGYLRRFHENSAAFVDDKRYGRAYLTGDRARVVWDTKGIPLLEYLGRFSDDQVKINGQRVELGEIESVLCNLPEIRSAVAVVEKPYQNGRNGLSITACLILEPTAKLSLESVKERCKESIASRLPTHMQPVRFQFLSQLPRTSAGKIDRKEIARVVSKQHASWQESSRLRRENGVRSPRRASRSPEQRGTQILRSLESAFQKTVGASGSAAEHLKYGLDSLSALRFLRNIKEQNIDVLSLKDVLHARSVRDLARVAGGRSQEQRLNVSSKGRYISADLKGRLDNFRARWQVAVQQKFKIAAEDVQEILPTTATQARLLLSFSKSCFQPTRQRNYVHHSIHTFAQETDINKLKFTWCNVLERHDIYRTAFMAVDDDLSCFAQAILSRDSRLSQIRWIDRSGTGSDINPENADINSAAQEAESLVALESPAPVLTLLKTRGRSSILVSMLHAIFDLGSLHLLLEEVAAALEGKRPLFRRESRLAAEAHFASQNTETNVFWSDYMHCYEPLPFPSLTGIRSEMTPGSTSTSQITSVLSMDRFEKRSRDLLCSPLAALQAAWSAILLGYTSSTYSDVAFGSVFADRSDGGRDVCVAPTFSVVPTRTRSGESSLNIDILRTLTDGNIRAGHHLHPSLFSKTSHVPPFDTTIALQVFQDVDASKELWQNTVTLPMAHDYAVMIEAIPDAKGHICLKASYTDKYLDQKSAELMLSQLDEILIWILANPILPYRNVLNCLKVDKLSILNSSPSTEPAAESSLLHTQFELNARKYPDRTALEYRYSLQEEPGNIQRWSYREMNARANELAGTIRSKFGDVTGTVIPILMDKRPELYLAVLGILKAGAAWSPIDTSSPAQRRRGMVARIGAKLILVSQDAIVDKAGIPEGVEIMIVLAENSAHGNYSSEEHGHDQDATPDSLAYLIWTSGTTGAPKGVPISHRAGYASMRALQANIPCRTKSGAPARCLQFSQHTFDVFVQDLFFTWGIGGTVISASREIMTSSFAEMSRRSEATHAHLTPAFAATVRRESCPHLEVITMIGEKLPQNIADNWGRNLQGYNTYGPAEATVVSTLGEFSGSFKYNKSSIIGRPLPSISCYVLRDGKEVMIQGVGELALGGPQLAQGYLNDPKMTSAKFIKHGIPQKDLYLTGDVVRQLADGRLDFIGREDDLVKIGGIRVELSEISFAMRNCHKLIHQIETCYISRRDRPGKAVVSFIAANVEHEVMNRGQSICTPEAAQIARCAMSQAQQSLPGSMVPSTVVILQKIPNTSSAKVDRKMLEKAFEDLDLESWEVAMRAGQSEVSDEQELSENGLKIRQCLSEFSNAPLETIHLHSSLHSLGIDSLSAARFVQHLTDFGVFLNIAHILRSQTVHDVLRILQEKDSKIIVQNNPNFPAEKFSKAWLPHVQSCLDQEATFVMPTTPLQEGVLSESMLNELSYWSNHFFELRPTVAIDRLHSAWGLVSRDTEALRTCFLTVAEVAGTAKLPQSPSAFLQVILDGPKLDWAELVVESELRDTAKERADRIATHHQNTTFHQPPWAVTIIKVGSSKQMMLTIHHVIHDAESINFIIRDLASAYRNLTVPTRCQIRDALPASISCNGREKDDMYWHKFLRQYADNGLPPWPNFIGTGESIKKTVLRSMISERLELRLDLEEVADATRSLETNFSVILKVAFGCLLLDYLETPAVVFAEIISQRVRNPQYRDAIAPLSASNPVAFSAKETVMELLSEHSYKAAQSWSHGSPSGPLVRKILRRSPQQPLYPAVFVFQPPEEKSSEGEQSSETELWRQGEDHLGLSVEHDLALNVFFQDGWVLELTASDLLMNQDSLKISCLQIEALTQAILRNPNRPLLGLLDKAEQGILSISESWLPEREDHRCNVNPIYWLEYHAQHHPDWNAAEVATSVGFLNTETIRWSFKTLFQTSRKIARFIHERDYRGEIIAVCTGRTLQSYAIIVGIFMSGNTYLPIDDGLPQQRKFLLLEDSKCTLVFTDRACAAAFGDAPSNCTILDVDDTFVARELQETSDAACPPPSPGESAYLLYTSGSTGKPKGVLISYISLCGFIEGLTNFMGQCSLIAQSQAGVGKWLGLASRAFDVHLAEIFLPWRSGLTAVTAPRELLLDDLRLALTSLKVTHACFVPSLLEQAELTPDQIPDFVFMTIGGEKLSKRIVDTWAGHPRITVVNAYGPTELAIGCSASHVVPHFNVSNIGFPYGNTVAHILVPDTLHYAKKGQAGELCFTGCLVGNGYLNRPDAKGFVENFLGERMYRTGDMARMFTDGSIEYLGRSDDQTKIRGQRVELSEISESIRNSSKDALEVVTLLVNHPGLPSTFLTSFFSDSVERTKRYDAKPSLVDKRLGEYTTRINEHCKRSLPAYMVPDYIIPVDNIPLARISGKADVKTLKAFFASIPVQKLLGAVVGESHEMNQREMSPSEMRIAAVAKTVLNVEDQHDIRRYTNLFALGLDSLNAVGLIVKLREIGLQCSLTLILGNPTVECLANRGHWGSIITSHSQRCMNENFFRTFGDAILGQDDLRISKDAVEKTMPCLPVQESMVTATLNSGGSKSYINNVMFELNKDVDLHRFKKAWLDMIEETPILRTVFHHYQDSFVQLVLWPRTVLSPWTEMITDRESSARDLLSDLAKGIDHDISETFQDRPALRLHLARTKRGGHLFSVVIHHALYDGHSFDMMMEDLWLRYSNLSVPHRTPFETLLEYRAAQDAALQESFWNQYLVDSHPTRISDNVIMEDESSASISQSLNLNLSKIRHVANKSEVTLASLTQCLFAIILARRMRRLDILFGSVLSGRSVPVQGAESIMAPCITTIPQRIQFQCDEVFSQLLRRVQDTSTKCLEYQHTSLRDISRWAHLEQPMFEALFSFTYKDSQKQDFAPWTQVKSSMFLGYPLAVEFTADSSSDALAVTCEYTHAFGTEKDAKVFIEDMEILMTMMYGGDDPRVSNLGLVEQAFACNSDAMLWDETSWSAEEDTVRHVLQNFTGMEPNRITKNVSFFQLGVDSISAIRLAKCFRQNDLSVSSAHVMRHPSIGSLGHYLSNQSESSLQRADPVDTIDQATLSTLVGNHLNTTADSIEATYYCTSLQAGMITATLASSGDAYVHRHTRELPAEVSVERLREAWAMTVRSLDILRTSFHYTNEKGPQWIACVHRKMTTAPLDCFKRSQPSLNVAPIRLLKEEDFRMPPFQATFSHNGKQLVFQLTLHHALYDGISLPMIFERLSLAYRNGSVEALQIPSFHDAAQLISKTALQSTGFWLARLKGYRNLNLHKMSNEAPRQISLTRKCSVSLEIALENCKILGVTLQTVLLTAHSKVLAVILGRRDIAFGHVVSGRSLPQEGCESVVGPLFNTVPLRFRLDHLLSSNQDMMNTILDLTSKAQAHQHASLTQVQHEWRKNEGCDGARVFDSIFLFQKVASAAQDDFTRPIEDGSYSAASEYCLNFEVEQNGTELVLSLSCHEGCLVDRSLDVCLDMFEEVLQNILDNPARAIGSHPQGLSALPLEISETETSRPLVKADESGDDSHLRVIKAILAKVSRVPLENITSTASIFALGLTSLSAMTVAVECRRQGLELSVANVLQGVTAQGIYQQVNRNTKHKEKTKKATTHINFRDLLNPLVKKECIESILPALSGQTYHLNGWLQSGRTMYMPTWSYTCPKLDPSRLQHAWVLLRERHPILRTTFSALSSTKAVQLVLKHSGNDESSFSCFSGRVDTQAVQQSVREQQEGATDMKTPPVRLRIIQGPSHDVMLLTIHHALYDAWSLPILISDLTKLSNGVILESPPDWQHFVEQSTTDLESLNGPTFWRKTLSPVQKTVISRRRPAVNDTSIALPKQSFISLPQILSNIPDLSLRCRNHNTSLPTLLLLSFARSLCTLTHATNPIFGIFNLGRSASFPYVSQIAGPCLNMLPHVVRSPWEEPWSSKAQEIQTELAARVPFEQNALPDVLEWARGRGEGEMEFNAYVNILWRNGDEETVQEEGDSGMFKLIDVGVPSDFVPERSFEGETGLEELQWPVARDGVYVDIALSRDGESVDIGARIENEIIGDEEAVVWLSGIGEGVREMLRTV